MRIILLFIQYINPICNDSKSVSYTTIKNIKLSVIVFNFITFGDDFENESLYNEKFDPNNKSSFVMKLLTPLERQKNELNVQYFNNFLVYMKKYIAENKQPIFMIENILKNDILKEMPAKIQAQKTFNLILNFIIYKIDIENLPDELFVFNFHNMSNYKCLNFHNINDKIQFGEFFIILFDNKISIYHAKIQEIDRYIIDVHFEFFFHVFFGGRIHAIFDIASKVKHLKDEIKINKLNEKIDVVSGYFNEEFKNYIEPIILELFETKRFIKQISFFVELDIKRYTSMLEFFFFNYLHRCEDTKYILLAGVKKSLISIDKILVDFSNSNQFNLPARIKIYTIV